MVRLQDARMTAEVLVKVMMDKKKFLVPARLQYECVLIFMLPSSACEKVYFKKKDAQETSIWKNMSLFWIWMVPDEFSTSLGKDRLSSVLQSVKGEEKSKERKTRLLRCKGKLTDKCLQLFCPNFQNSEFMVMQIFTKFRVGSWTAQWLTLSRLWSGKIKLSYSLP